MSGTSRCLFSDKYKTHKYSVGRTYSCWMSNCWCITWPVGVKRFRLVPPAKYWECEELLVIRNYNSSPFERRKFKYINNGGLCTGGGSIAVKADYIKYWGRRNNNAQVNKNFPCTVTDFQNLPHIVTVYSLHEYTVHKKIERKLISKMPQVL